MSITNGKRRSKKTSSLIFRCLIVAVVWTVSIGFNYAYAFFFGPSDNTFTFAMLACMLSLINLLWFVVDAGNSSSDQCIPNEGNHFAPGYLDPGAINSSEVDPGNPSMDPFDPFDSN
ncbi:hypothetical protein [uncultured Propionivibrio sp.]|uniref:hypothetical protein n=1 Tax=uncultured Propionivibrio sp. TaxID=426737 RepID=UPI0029C0305C|nr:hypothetical protein [uncultured Propionivibrio sp.]